MADVFLSYSRENQAIARRFAEGLEREGLSVWWDQALSAGQSFDRVTEQALADARAVVVLWSRQSVDSRWVRAEATEAERSKKLVPVMIESCKRPILFELVHTAELSHWKGDRDDPAWKVFIRDLRAGSPAVDSGITPRTRLPVKTRRFTLIAAGALVVAAALAFMLWRAGAGQPERTSVPIQIETFAADGGAQSSTTAQALRNTAQAVLGKAGFQTRLVGSIGARTGLGLKGSVIDDAQQLKFYLAIEDLASGVVIWSQQFAGASAAADSLGMRAVVAAAESFNNVRQVESQKGLWVSPELLARFIEGLNLVTVTQSLEVGKARQIFEDIVAREPRSATAHAILSLILAGSASGQQPAQRMLLSQQVRAEAEKAIQIDPVASGAAYDALYGITTLTSPTDLIQQQEQLLNGLKHAPDFAFLSMRMCESLLNTGRVREALSYCQRAAALRPLAAPVGWRLALALDMDRQRALAEKAIAQTIYYNPDAATAQLVQFRLLVYADAPERAKSLLSQLRTRNPDRLEGADYAFEAFLDARGSGNRAREEKAVSAILAAAKNTRLSVGDAAKALAELGKLDEAFALLQGSDSGGVSSGGGFFATYFLFEPVSRPLRADPRFWKLAARLGLVDYWKKQQVWPDFCSRELKPGECQESAAGM